jgi:hypothetical protein
MRQAALLRGSRNLLVVGRWQLGCATNHEKEMEQGKRTSVCSD